MFSDFFDIFISDQFIPVVDFATVYFFKTIDGTKQRTFTTTTWSTENYNLVFMYIQTHIVQYGKFPKFFCYVL